MDAAAAGGGERHANKRYKRAREHAAPARGAPRAPFGVTDVLDAIWMEDKSDLPIVPVMNWLSSAAAIDACALKLDFRG